MTPKQRYNFERLEELRKDKHINQTEIARILGISQRNYSHYEKGDTNIPLDILIKLAKFHETSIDYLLNLTDYPEPYPRKKEKKMSWT